MIAYIVFAGIVGMLVGATIISGVKFEWSKKILDLMVKKWDL
jgi:hypothetical protein